jgi:linoleoyl-CoA desaturase
MFPFVVRFHLDYWLLVLAMFAGFILGVAFQLAHTIEETVFPVLRCSYKRYRKRMHIQSIENQPILPNKVCKIDPLVIGGLNFQIEHHLFSPKTSCALPRNKQEIIKKTCEEFNVKYIESQNVPCTCISRNPTWRRM